MSLSRAQKKCIKKNLKTYSLTQLTQSLEVSEKELLNYLKNHYSKEKYQHLLKEGLALPQTSSNSKGSFLTRWWVFPFLIILVFIAYFNSLGNDFVSDDIATIKDNILISQINYFWKEPYYNIFNFSFRSFINFIIYHLFILNPLPYRLSNIFFHAGSTILIYLLLKHFFKSSIPLFAASIFAVHPILAESVGWISGGPYSNGAFFALFSFLTYLNAKRIRSLYFLSLVLFLLALLSSEKLFVFPLIITLYEILWGSLNNWRKLLPFWIIMGLSAFNLAGLLNTRADLVAKISLQDTGINNPFLQIPIAVTSYLELIFWPQNLTLYHSEMNFTQLEYFLYLVIFTIFLGLIFYFLKRERKIFFWLMFFLVSLAPTLTPFRVSSIVAERYVYFASVGIFVFIAWLIENIGHPFKTKKIIYFIFIPILLVLATRTVVRNNDWKNQDTLWVATAKTSPSSFQNHNNLGDLYMRQNDPERAIEEFKKAIELKPNYADAYHNLANTYYQLKNYGVAAVNYKKAIDLDPSIWQSYQNLATIYFAEEKLDVARENLEKAVSLNPKSSNSYVFLGTIYSEMGEKIKAKENLERALELEPQNQKAKELLISLE